MKRKQNNDFYLKRFQEVVCFLTAVRIKKHFKTIAEYKKAENSSKAYCLNISYNILQKLSTLPPAPGKRCFEEFLKVSNTLFTYHRHCHKIYKSKKKFSRNSWFELSDSTLDKWFSDSKNFNTSTCKLIDKETHKWIDKHMYCTFDTWRKKQSINDIEKIDKCLQYTINSLEKEDNNMTKAEEKAIYKKYDDGKGAFTTPEFEIKQIKKKERAQKRRQETIAKKAVQASFEEFAKLKAENEQLKAEIARLKQLKDLNSDIPNENLTETELNKLKEEAAAWRRINQDPLACEQHYNEVLSRMPQSEDNSVDNIEITPVMQDQLNQIYQLETNIAHNMENNIELDDDKIVDELCKTINDKNTNIVSDFVKNGSDIPEVLPEQAPVEQPTDDIPTDEEQTVDKASLLSFMLQDLVNNKVLQKSEADTLRDFSIWKSEIPIIKDKFNVTLDDTQQHVRERYRVALYIQQCMSEFNLENWNQDKYPKNWAEKVFRDFGHMNKKNNKKNI